MMNRFLAVVWDVDPVFFWLGKWDIRYYGVMWALAILIGALFFIDFCKKEGLPQKYADRIFFWGVIATVLGARLGHCLFYQPEFYLQNPIEILKFRDGGMASHGAAIGLLIGLWGFARTNRLPYLWPLDRVMVPVGIGGALVRFGNLLNSEIYGGPTDLPWGFIFVRNGEVIPKHPTQIYEALCYLLVFAVLCWMYYRKNYGRRYPGVMFGVGLIGIFLSRFLLEFIKNPQVQFEESMALNMGQLLSLPFIIVGVVMVWYGFSHPAPEPAKGGQSHKTKERLAAQQTGTKTAKKR